MTKIFSIDGKIVEAHKPNEVYLGLFQRNGYWSISGVMYREATEAQSNLWAFNPDKILIVKVMLPPESEEGDGS